MKRNLQELFRALFLNWISISVLELFYRLSGFFFFTGLGRILLDFSIRSTSYTYLTSQNALSILLSPVSILCLILWLSAFVLFIFIESCILMTAFEHSAGGVHMDLLTIFLWGTERGFRCLRREKLRTVLPVVSFFTISNLFFLYQILYRINPFCTYFPILLEYRGLLIFLGLLLLLLFLYTFRNFFSFPYLYYADLPIKEGKKKSRRLSSRHIIRLIASFLLIAVISVFIWFLLRVLILLPALAGIRLFVEQDLRTALALTLNPYISLVSLFIAATCGSMIFTGLITIFFFRYSGVSAPGPDTLSREKRVSRRQRFVISLSILSVFSLLSASFINNLYDGTLDAERAMSFTEIIAHRGVSSQAPENTLPAFEQAIDYLSDSIELDVQCTADGEVVVFHDISLKRVTGLKKNLEFLPLEEIRELDAGSFFSKAFADTQIPTLREVLELAKGRINLVIELKRNKAGIELVDKVLDLIEEYDMEHQCVLQSSDYAYLLQVKERKPDMVTGYILSAAIGKYYTDESIDFFCVRSLFITQSAVKKAHEAGKQIYAWTVNTRAELERMKHIQVDAVITDDPIFAREIIYREDIRYSWIRLLKLALN